MKKAIVLILAVFTLINLGVAQDGPQKIELEGKGQPYYGNGSAGCEPLTTNDCSVTITP